ncbi:hypothetical protein Pmar_PMAR000232 [Perkinsus marinus ATCC 50983]|uniref:Uncharacterized protein n=1 Tax=Perkinsus marinus (strain ATCC 50983 / TXsc) TaxID=423536 RepID=C5LNW0_PERM5|nr:hypothetical protein Pmar_PMAR000232 [Perkinsus marinus ATCC 50983]EER01542.1 hypothetical protein Pmar_PMAR000232 [Perkinsus marinus ATCC 50983]|eukprot:XP_002768824.1 hypothetical protein Pmar_PMAR000232 [Perkinsus marinus ATCC 50983]
MAPFQLELGYETVQKDDKEVQALADVTLRTTIESTSASEEPDYRAIDVLLNPDLLKQVERDDAAGAVPFNKEDDMRHYGRELMKKSRALRLQKTNCEATDSMSYWIAHPHDDSGRSIKWTVSLKLEMDDPEDGFRIREVSNSFGKNYDP